MITKEGFIKKAISGFYYVVSQGECYECKARGIFRNNDQTPLVGDKVIFEVDENDKGIVNSIAERKNEFLRPPMANLDKLFIVISTCDPSPSLFVIDKLIAVCEFKDIEPIIVITKIDLKSSQTLEEIYQKAGFRVISVSNIEVLDSQEIKAELAGCISAFAGNTGVGKSSLLNNIYPELQLTTAHTSKKLGRGRHTTRHVELYPLDDVSGYVADTPGFGSMEMERYDIIRKDKLQFCFREFAPYLNKCKFTGCSHTAEKGCTILEAVAKGDIQNSRFESYKSLYRDAQSIKEWDLPQHK